MRPAQHGDTVTIHYTGSLTNGSVFDSSVGDKPFSFILGKEPVIPGFEKSVTGMSMGEKKTVVIPAGDAYGPHMAEMMVTIERSTFPQEITPEVGLQLEMQNPEGTTIPVCISALTDTTITLDANHPLAGEDLKFEIELIDIKPASLIIQA